MRTSREIEAIIGPIPNWYEFEPNDLTYIKHSPNIVASFHKVGDVFDTYCNARAALLFAYQDNLNAFMVNDDESGLQFIRSHLLLNSLMLYNICIDLSWQVLWLRFEVKDLELINNKKIYERSLNNCNFETLQYQLTLAREIKIRNYIRESFNGWTDFRRKYNYYKHRGSFFIEGLGENEDKLMISINGETPKCFSREEFNLSDWTDKLIEFNGQFGDYFENIISFIIPSNASEPIGANEIIKYMDLLQNSKSQTEYPISQKP